MLRFRSLLWVMLIGILALPAMAQGAQSWEIALYATEENTIYVANAEGVTQAILLPTYQGNPFIPHHISNDFRLAAGTIAIPSETQDPRPTHIPAIANLKDNTCCLLLDLPMAQGEEFFIQFSNFNADGSRIVASTNNFSFDNNTGASNGGGVMSVVDTITGEIIYQVTTTDFFAYLFDWKADGVRFLRSPLGGSEWLPEGRFGIWNPETNDFVDTSDEIVLWRGDVLRSTGEVVDAAYNTGFPTMEVGMITPANVVEYFPAGVSPFVDDTLARKTGQVVFYNPQDLNLYTSWILDGNAFLTHNGFYQVTDTVTVVKRGGEQVTLDTPGQRFLAGTPDGWLMSGSDAALYHYFQSGDGFNVNQLAKFAPPPPESYYRSLVPLTTPEIGLGLTSSTGFPTVERTVPQPPPNPPVCDGALPSRLEVGGTGWVLPGDNNNLRDRPTTKGSKVGELMAGLGFRVLEGPECADGYAWFRVEDNLNQTGWTAEGNGDEYWVEPIK